MRSFLEFAVKSLVDHPEEVEISERETAEAIEVTIKVSKEDLGKVIGKNGRVIKAIRTVVRNIYGSSKKRIVISVA
ncbi:MAG: KH domain-containing protein [Coprothermobacterota bacterium]|nr:KH domain-containing protein [Coprothermobacterota bacterium]